ncbi:MAG: family transporter substrate-binding protein [Acidimicrobiaceae bacterium]|jgi:basic membrane protein A|nr:family transporter substrate-binding protein [Acidimicrobiaceae bacterium]
MSALKPHSRLLRGSIRPTWRSRGRLVTAAALCGAASFAVSVAGAGASTTAKTTRSHASSGSKVHACLMVSNVGIDDHGFNQEAWDALVQAHKTSGVSIKYLAESGSITYTTIGSEFISEGCNLIVGEGFDTANEIKTLATENPKVKFALIDDTLSSPLPNVSELVYHTDEAAFLGGYVAAATTKTKVIGMYGNEPIPPVVTYLDGFYAGVKYYDKINHANVQTIGFNPSNNTGEFMGSFSDTTKATTITQSELAQGADIIYPVGLPSTAAEAVKQYGHGALMEFVDADGCPAYPALCSVQLTSVEKNILPTLFRVIESDVTGRYDSGIFRGTLRNNGVGLAPFHDLAKKVPAKVQAEVATLEKGIIQGKINYNPYATNG